MRDCWQVMKLHWMWMPRLKTSKSNRRMKSNLHLINDRLFLKMDCGFFLITGEPRNDTFKVEGNVLCF